MPFPGNRYKLSPKFTTIQNGRHLRSPAIMETETGTKSWLPKQCTHKFAPHFNFNSDTPKMTELRPFQCQGHLVTM